MHRVQKHTAVGAACLSRVSGVQQSKSCGAGRAPAKANDLPVMRQAGACLSPGNVFGTSGCVCATLSGKDVAVTAFCGCESVWFGSGGKPNNVQYAQWFMMVCCVSAFSIGQLWNDGYSYRGFTGICCTAACHAVCLVS
jgi:hypothetical protein